MIANDAEVTLMLAGGHIIRLSGVTDLAPLVACLENPQGENVVEIPSGGGQVTFIRRESIIGIMRRPQHESMHRDAGQQSVPYFSKQGLLNESDHGRVRELMSELAPVFEKSTVVPKRSDYRNSYIVSGDTEVQQLIIPKLMDLLPEIQTGIYGSAPSDQGNLSVECQITAHRNRGFYRVHSDNGSPDTASRRLTFVYYFQTRPDSFFGGTLRLYNNRTGSLTPTIDADFIEIEPLDNSIILFPSSTLHEVLPTYVPSGDWLDSRFTANGWLRW